MKELILKDWLWQKIARENNAPRVWGGHVDCIFSETEKAYKVIMGSVNHQVITWVPKSQVSWETAKNEANETKVFGTYEEALEYSRFLKSCFC